MHITLIIPIMNFLFNYICMLTSDVKYTILVLEIFSEVFMSINSFKYAIKGIIKEMLSGASFKVMLVFMAGIVAAGIFFGITLIEWALLLLCCGGVLTAEMINTAIESVVDLTTKDISPLAEKAKDLAAGAVLVFSIFAAGIGAIIFIPYIIALF